MKKNIFLSLLMLIIALCSCTKDEVETNGAIYGIVNDADNGEPIKDAHVALNPSGKTANTGSDGRYEFLDLEPGQYTIQITKTGYKTNTKRINVIAGEQASGDMVLSRGESRIKLSTRSLNFTGKSTSKTFTIENIGTSGSASWSVTVSDSWLSVTPVSGTTASGKSSTVVVNVDRSKITEDVTTNLIVEADGESLPVEVSVTKNGGGDEGGEGGEGSGGSCGKITSCDSKVNVSFLQCIKNGNVVEFEFMVTNNGEDWRVWFNVSKAICVDDKGNTYQGIYMPFYIGDSKVTDGNPFYFLKNTPMKCRVVVQSVKDGAAFFKRFDMPISSTTPWNPQLKKITFEDIKW